MSFPIADHASQTPPSPCNPSQTRSLLHHPHSMPPTAVHTHCPPLWEPVHCMLMAKTRCLQGEHSTAQHSTAQHSTAAAGLKEPDGMHGDVSSSGMRPMLVRNRPWTDARQVDSDPSRYSSSRFHSHCRASHQRLSHGFPTCGLPLAHALAPNNARYPPATCPR